MNIIIFNTVKTQHLSHVKKMCNKKQTKFNHFLNIYINLSILSLI